MDSSAEKVGSEDCRNTGIGNNVDLMMFGSEDSCAGGNIVSEVCGVGGCIDLIAAENCRHEDVSHMEMLQRTKEERRICLQRSSVANSCSSVAESCLSVADRCSSVSDRHFNCDQDIHVVFKLKLSSFRCACCQFIDGRQALLHRICLGKAGTCIGNGSVSFRNIIRHRSSSSGKLSTCSST